MRTNRSTLLALLTLALVAPPLARADQDATHDFDFWNGDWAVTVQAALPDGSWKTAEGQSSTQTLAGGNAHFDTLATDLYKSSGVRAYNVATGKWDYTMFDNLQMKGLKVWSGSFTDGVGTFSAKLELPTGVAADTRVIIDDIDENAFKWRFELSMDGSSWRTVMKMDFRRAK